MIIFRDKTLMITGGTGSFGNAVLRRFLKTDIAEIRIFSRNEKKQDDMRHEFQATMPEVADKIKFFIGDVRDLASVKNAMYGVDYIFHAAALKQVPSCEFFPLEAVKTNVHGTDNVLTAAIEAGVESVICLSTDKAAYPVNAMGTSKAMMEKVIVAKSRTVSPDKTRICCTRYGNVMCSRGSVISFWIEQIKAGKPITLTEPSMTRFIMSLDEAVTWYCSRLSTACPGISWYKRRPPARSARWPRRSRSSFIRTQKFDRSGFVTARRCMRPCSPTRSAPMRMTWGTSTACPATSGTSIMISTSKMATSAAIR